MTIKNKSFGEKMKLRIYNLILKIIKFTESLPKNDEVCKVANNQLIRSATSVCANYVEATAGTTKKDFSNFLSYSLKSANESKFWLALLKDTKKGNKNTIDGLLKELIEISNILGTSISTMKKK